MPASLGRRPGGRTELNLARSCSPSARVRCIRKGAVGAGLVVGGAGFEARVEGGGAGRAGAAVNAVVDRRAAVRASTSPGEGCSGSWADQGVKRAVVVKVPQPGGVISGVRPPSRKCSLKESKGSWGIPSKVRDSRPVRGRARPCRPALPRRRDRGPWRPGRGRSGRRSGSHRGWRHTGRRWPSRRAAARRLRPSRSWRLPGSLRRAPSRSARAPGLPRCRWRGLRPGRG